MTYKNAKTILFAGLIAAMVVPFSGMNTASAEEKIVDWNEAKKVSDTLDDLIIQYNALETQRHVILDELKNPGLTENQRDLLQIKYNQIINKMDSIEIKVEVLSQIEEEYDPSDPVMNDITTGSTIYAGGDHTACSDWDLSYTTTVQGVIDANMDIIAWTWSAPDHKNVGWSVWTGCADVYFEEISIITRNTSQGQSCTYTYSNTTVGDEIETCNCGISSGDIITWQVDITYEPYSGSDTRGNDTWAGMHRVS